MQCTVDAKNILLLNKPSAFPNSQLISYSTPSFTQQSNELRGTSLTCNDLLAQLHLFRTWPKTLPSSTNTTSVSRWTVLHKRTIAQARLKN